MTQLTAWALQGLLLTLGIFAFLRLVRRTRGGRVVRGLVIALLVGVVGVWLLVQELQLEFLDFLLEQVAPLLAILLVILFQADLRQGIAQLGSAGLLNRLLQTVRKDVLSEVARACAAMASRRHGALIAFERENSLDAYVDGGVPLDSEVQHLLLESIFHPGGTLHDGAVVVRGDRIAAASCLFPLTENLELARSTGTRHRAGLGITDETDAVTVVVSEETGKISVCKRGVIQPGIPHGKLEELLREEVGRREEDTADPRDRRRERARRFFRHDLPWLFASALLATAILYTARQSTVEETQAYLRTAVVPGDRVRPPAPGELVLLLPKDHAVVEEPDLQDLELTLRGSHAQLVSEEVRGLGGTVQLPAVPGPFEIETDDDSVTWNFTETGFELSWRGGSAPVVLLARLEARTVVLSPEQIPVDTRQMDARYEARADEMTFSAASVQLRGPAEEMAVLPAQLFRPVVITRFDDRPRTETLLLGEDLLQRGFSLLETGNPVTATVPILPASRNLGQLSLEMVLVCTDPARSTELPLFSIPDDRLTQTLAITSSGLIQSKLAPEEVARQEKTIQQWVEETVVLCADIAKTQPPDMREVPIHVWGLENWRVELAARLATGPIKETARLWVEVVGEDVVRLEYELENE